MCEQTGAPPAVNTERRSATPPSPKGLQASPSLLTSLRRKKSYAFLLSRVTESLEQGVDANTVKKVFHRWHAKELDPRLS